MEKYKNFITKNIKPFFNTTKTSYKKIKPNDKYEDISSKVLRGIKIGY